MLERAVQPKPFGTDSFCRMIFNDSTSQRTVEAEDMKGAFSESLSS